MGRYLDSPWSREKSLPDAIALVERVHNAAAVGAHEALATAAVARDWSVHWYDRDRVAENAAQAIGPPWQAKHKLAVKAALAAMRLPA